MEKQEISPKEYFDRVKEKKNTITEKNLQEFYDASLKLANKYQLTGQTDSLRKMIFYLENVEKEKELVKLGINTFVYKEDIEEFIQEVATNVVKVIELENYEREIPEEILDVIIQTKGIFDQLYVVFTDYTGKHEKKVEKKRREKDPILFGSFQNVENQQLSNRFYYLGDWEDEFCDLTLAKMVSMVQNKKNGKDIVQNIIEVPLNLDELKEGLNRLEKKGEKDFRQHNKPVSGMFGKIKSVLKKEGKK